MKEVRHIAIGTNNFVLHPIKPLRVLELNQPLLRMLVPLLSGLGSLLRGIDLAELDTSKMSNEQIGNKILSGLLSKELDFSMLALALGQALEALPPKDLISFLCSMSENVQYIPKAGDPLTQAVFLRDPNLLDELDWTPADMYRLILEVAMYNRFLPFGLAPIGAQSQKTLG